MNSTGRGSTHSHTVETARALRRRQTRAEELLWEALRARRLCGVKFRRQHPFDKFILDFFCPHFQLAIEVDGPVHDDADHRNYDEARAVFLTERGVRVLRFTNSDIENRLSWVLEVIQTALVNNAKANNAPMPPSPGRS